MLSLRTMGAAIATLFVGLGAPLPAQIASPNATGVAMGHLHYFVRDVASNHEFWVRLGGESIHLDERAAIRFPNVLVILEADSTSGNSEGSVINHVAFRVESLDAVEAAGFEVERLEEFPGVASVHTPGGERIELFDETATNLTFTVDDGRTDPVAERHNQPITRPVVSHHIHLYLPEGAEEEAKAWYRDVFGGTPGMRWRYPAVDFPGINFNFSGNGAQAPTRGRMLDHIGFEIANLEEFCERLEGLGVEFDVPYALDGLGNGYAYLTDPWGTTIELNEGFDGR